MKILRAIEMISPAVFANGSMLVEVDAGEVLRVMHVTGTPRANEVTAAAAAALIAADQAKALDDVPEGLEHHSLVNGPYVPIAAPAGLTAVAGDKVVVLTWDPVERATSYVVFRARVKNGEAFHPIASYVTEAAYTDTDVVNGAEYRYAVAGFDCAGQGPMSDLEGAPSAMPMPLPERPETSP